MTRPRKKHRTGQPGRLAHGLHGLARGDGYPYQASTVDFYNTWEDMGKDEGKAWQAVYPSMSGDRIGQKIESTRSIYKTEVRRLVDFVE